MRCSNERVHSMTHVDEPVLVLGFNRPGHLEQLLGSLREVRPARLYVAIDGPRHGHPTDEIRVQQCRELVKTIDWTSDVSTLFQEHNLGCGAGVTTAISWFFTNETRGIILEDDILPATPFFRFATDLLDRYECDDRVFAVSGFNAVPPSAQTSPQMPYRFSQIPHVWGWATWRRSWAHHRLDLSDWRERLPAEVLWERCGRSLTGALYWGAVFDMVARGQIDTWDHQLAFASMCVGQLTATSNVNLAENTGFTEDATHEFGTVPEWQPIGSPEFPLADVEVAVDDRADGWTRKEHYYAHRLARLSLERKNPNFRAFVAEIQAISTGAGGRPTP